MTKYKCDKTQKDKILLWQNKKKTDCKYDNIQKDKRTKTKVTKYNKTEKIWHNTKRQKTNMTKYNPVLLRQKNDKTQKVKIHMWQNAKRPNTNMTKCKKTNYKCDKMQ